MSGIRHQTLEVAGEAVLPVRKHDLGPDSRKGRRVDPFEEAPVQLLLEIEGPLEDGLRPPVVREGRRIGAQRFEGRELSREYLVVEMGQDLIGRGRRIVFCDGFHRRAWSCKQSIRFPGRAEDRNPVPK